MIACWFALLVVQLVAVQRTAPDVLGVHVELSKEGLRTVESLNVRWVRIHDDRTFKWSSVEHEKGRWHIPEGLAELFQMKGINLIVNLGLTPRWASSDSSAGYYPHRSPYFGPAAYAPRDWGDWSRYVGRLTSTLKMIRTWEILNEPDIHFMVAKGASKAATYEQYVHHTTPLVRAANDSNKILAPSAAFVLYHDDFLSRMNPVDRNDSMRSYRDTAFLREWFDIADSSAYDVFTFHHYSYRDRSIITLARQGLLRPRFRRLRSDIGGKPIWLTEFNVLEPIHADTSLPKLLRVARQLVIEHFLLLDAGVNKIVTYSALPQGKRADAFHNFYDAAGEATEVLHQYRLMSQMLGRGRLSGLHEIQDGILRGRIVGADSVSVFLSLSNVTRQVVVEPGRTIFLDSRQIVKVRKQHSIALEPFTYFYML